MPTLIDLTAKRFGTFTVQCRATRPGARSAWWLVACDCGIEFPVRGDSLKDGNSHCPKCSDGLRGRVRRIVPAYTSIREIIEATSEFVTECGCRIWTGDTDQGGYGKLYFDRKTIGAHRAAWIDECGPVPHGLNVLHRCDTPPCINVAHLFLGTQSDNIADYWAKRRRFERAIAQQSL